MARFKRGRFDVELVRSKEHGWIWFDMWWTGRWNMHVTIGRSFVSKPRLCMHRDSARKDTVFVLADIPKVVSLYFDFCYNPRRRIHRC